jgi:hypothetical protein
MVEYKSNVWQIKGLRYCSKNNKIHWEISQPMMAKNLGFPLLQSVQVISPKIRENLKEIWFFSTQKKKTLTNSVARCVVVWEISM